MNLDLVTGDTPTRNEAVSVFRAKAELRAALERPRREGRTIGLVPTMGYLHEGHLSLLRAARAECDLVVMSLFVNPTQFGPGEDLDRYPRDEERDLRLAGEAGADFVYAPPVAEVYPEGFATAVEVGGELTEVLDGDPARRGAGALSRRHHRRRQALQLRRPRRRLLRPEGRPAGGRDPRMVRDLDFPVRIEVLPTVREADGLAMSSRNAYLEPARPRARGRALAGAGRGRARRPGAIPAPPASKPPAASWPRAGIEPEYLEARDAERLEPVTELGEPPGPGRRRRPGRRRAPDRQRLDPTLNT